MKPIVRKLNNESGENYHCPKCKQDVQLGMNYCPNCGQKLLWENEENESKV